MNIAIPVLCFGREGGNRVLAQLANEWKSRGHEVCFIVPSDSVEPYYPTYARIIWIDSSGVETSFTGNTRKKQRGLNTIFAIYRHMVNNHVKYDVVIANYNMTTYPILFSVPRNKRCYYIQAYEPELVWKNNPKRLKTVISALAAWISYYLPFRRIVNADLYKKYRNIRARDVVLPGIDYSKFYFERNRGKNQKLIVGCIGRKEKWKGSFDVEKAVEKLQDEGYPIVLKAAFYLHNSKRHELEMPDGDSNLADYYRSLDVLVAPGHIQIGAIHYPVIEAMACGTPVITTGYFPAKEDNCFLVLPQNQDDIAEKLKLVMGNYPLALVKAERAKNAVDCFGWGFQAEKFIEILLDTSTQKGCG